MRTVTPDTALPPINNGVLLSGICRDVESRDTLPPSDRQKSGNLHLENRKNECVDHLNLPNPRMEPIEGGLFTKVSFIFYSEL